MKKYVSLAFRICWKTMAGFLIFILIYLLVAWILSSISVNGIKLSDQQIEMYIKTNGVHTDLVFPVKTSQQDWSKVFPYKNTANSDSTYRYIGLGWGDKGFYLETPEWSDLKFSTAFNAVFGLGSTAIHATYYRKMYLGEDCIKLNISESQYSGLIQYVNESLEKDTSGKSIHIPTHSNYGDNDAFYEANGSYSMLHTCNTWANNGLKAANLKACLWTPFDRGIFDKYQNN